MTDVNLEQLINKLDRSLHYFKNREFKQYGTLTRMLGHILELQDVLRVLRDQPFPNDPEKEGADE